MHYHVIIVGAGIAGLRVGIETLKKYPHLSCCILEKSDYQGGRIFTYQDSKHRWEAGAGRIASTHHRTRQLMKRYGLSFIPIKSDTQYIDMQHIDAESINKPNPFAELQSIFLEPLKQLSPEVLQTHTLYQLLNKIIGPAQTKSFIAQFPYYSEFHTLRADCALYAFETQFNASFGVCKGGLSQLIHAMVKEFVGRGGRILQKMKVSKVEYVNPHVRIHTPQKTFDATLCVLALPSEALRPIRGVGQLPVLKKLKMMPLLRIYAVFREPIHIPHTVTNGPIRHIIPINPTTIMISYTDGEDTKAWEGQKIQAKLIKALRGMFPDKPIDDPIFLKTHLWKNGCTYWLPGKYDVEEESRKSIQPLQSIPNLFLCSESFHETQCWVESALAQADKLLESL
jgi:phytoene dehydrogenase-like protein